VKKGRKQGQPGTGKGKWRGKWEGEGTQSRGGGDSCWAEPNGEKEGGGEFLGEDKGPADAWLLGICGFSVRNWQRGRSASLMSACCSASRISVSISFHNKCYFLADPGPMLCGI